jgi:hypothetical protein
MFSDRNNLALFYLFEFEQNVRNRALLYIQYIQPGDKTKGDFSLFLLTKINRHEQKSSQAGIRN